MTPRRWWGLLCAAGAILCFAIAGSYCSGCTPAQVATVDADVTKALGYENTLCLAARFLPGVAKDDALVACEILEPLTGAGKAFLDGIEARRATKDAGSQ